MNAVRVSGAQAVHPGYGFLSENKNFQLALQTAGVKFIGPGHAAITAMGDKISSKTIAKAAGVNIIPWWPGEVRAARPSPAALSDPHAPMPQRVHSPTCSHLFGPSLCIFACTCVCLMHLCLIFVFR
jgi:hypothetical protein